mmetsp:Transcript_36105/g.66721  ORF Transcript_36105/g.66721 Transcript_36105/m.66721 type:complete len:305 (-) Transcript_36105:767-1681(-)
MIPVVVHTIRVHYVVFIKDGLVVRLGEVHVPIPLGLENLEGHRDEIVVNGPAIETKETHEDEGIARSKGILHQLTHLSTTFLLKEAFFKYEEEAGSQEQGPAMPHVAVHDTEDKRESRTREQTRVDLLILRDTVCVDDALVDACEVVRLEIGGRIAVSLPERWIIYIVVIIDSNRSRLPSILEVIHFLLDVVDTLFRNPSIQTNHGKVTAGLHQCLAEHFLFFESEAPVADHRPSSFPVLSNLAQELANLDVTPLQHRAALVDSLINLLKTLVAGVRIPFRDSINGSLEVIAKFRKLIREASPD